MIDTRFAWLSTMLLVLAACGQDAREPAGTVIVNARVIDGSGGPSRNASVRVVGERIVRVGENTRLGKPVFRIVAYVPPASLIASLTGKFSPPQQRGAVGHNVQRRALRHRRRTVVLIAHPHLGNIASHEITQREMPP